MNKPVTGVWMGPNDVSTILSISLPVELTLIMLPLVDWGRVIDCDKTISETVGR